MIAFSAAQHFFSSVPAEQSPNKKRGYQTLCRTPSLSVDMVRQIEARCLYNGSDSDPVKWQFYHLTENLFAVAHSVALAERDEFGRKGRYLSHTLVISHQDLARLEYCPLGILTQFPFIRDLSQVIAQMQPGTMNVPPVHVEVEPAWRALAQRERARWDNTALVQLGKLAWSPPPAPNELKPVALNGEDADVVSILALLFALAGAHQRLALSFDTWAQDCNWDSKNPFVFQRFATGDKGRLTQFIDASSRRIEGLAPAGTLPPFGRWAEQVMPLLSLQNAAQPQAWAQQLEATLLVRSKTQKEAGNIPSDFFRQFAKINAPYVANAWVGLLPQGLSTELLNRFRDVVQAYPEAYLEVLHQVDIALNIQSFLFHELYALKDVPSRSDRAVFEKYFRANAPVLNSLAYLWAKKGKEWGAALRKLQPEDFNYVLSQLIGWQDLPLPLWDALVPPHIETWLQTATPAIQPKEWKDVLDRLEMFGDDALNQLATHFPTIRPEGRKVIGQWLEKYKGKATILRSMVPVEKQKKLFGLF